MSVRSRTDSSARRVDDLRQLRVAPDEGGRLVGKAGCARRVGVTSGGKLAGRPGCASWKTRSPRPRSLSRCSPRSRRVGAVGQLVDDQGGRGCRQQHLAAVAGGHDARGAVEGRPEVVALALGGLAGVQAHAHAERPGLAPRLLHEARCAFRQALTPSTAESKTAMNPSPIVLTTWPREPSTAPAQDRVVALEGVLHGLLVLLPEPRAAFDVGEQER